MSGPFRGLDPAEAVRRQINLPGDFPLVVKASSAGEWDFDAAFEFGLEIIIEGLKTRGGATSRGHRKGPRVTAFTFIANLAYYLAMHVLGLSVTYDAQTSVVGSTLLVLMLLWQFGYVLLAFHRVYADGWIGAGVKAAVMIAWG